MTKVEKSLRFGLSYEWKMTGLNHDQPQLYTKKFTDEKTELFRVGMKTAGKNHSSSNPAILFLRTTNLQMMGLKVLSVSFLKREDGNTDGSPWTRFKEIEMEQNDLKTESDETAGIQLFTSHFKLDETNLIPTEFEFSFKIYFTGIVENYRVQQLDNLKSQQLWTSVPDHQEGDFKLIAKNGKSFNVHKWVLAAWSPVFATLFGSEEEIESTHLALDCPGYQIEQFIMFIYTGALEGLVSYELMDLAVEYKIKTLEHLCQSALQDVYALSDDKKAMIAWHMDMDTESHLICNEINE